MLQQVQLEYHQDALVALVEQLLADHTALLPNLGKLVVIVPDLVISKEIRRLLLLHNDAAALIPPRILTLPQWVNAQVANELTILNNHGRELMMVEVLHEHPDTFGQGNQVWTLADELLKLFDELNLSDLDSADFANQFEQDHPVLGVYSENAQKIQILWQAREQQMQQDKVTDRISLYKSNLLTLLEQNNTELHLYAIGLDSLSALEQRFLSDCTWLQATHFEHASGNPENQKTNNALTHSLDHIFNGQEISLHQRSDELLKRYPESPFNNLSVLSADNREQEAACIDLQIRLWLHQGKQRIGVVTEDRLLARRISALLTRASLQIFDAAGWPLSTTRAAAALEHWLLCIDNDFHPIHLLDLLKSSFIKLESEQNAVLFYFEQHIIQDEQTRPGLENYRQAIESHSQRLGQQQLSESIELLKLLDTLKSAATPLLALTSDTHNAENYIKAVSESLQLLGLDQQFEQDPAGQRVLQELEDMRQGLQHRTLSLSWFEFRSWLGRSLETHNFRPDLKAGGVTITNYRQAATGQYDGLILAGSDQKSLPRKSSQYGIFNNEVKRELKLKNWLDDKATIFARFRRLLQAAPNVLISYTSEGEKGPQLASPWVSLLTSFHQHTWDVDLENKELQQHIRLKHGQPKSPCPVSLPSSQYSPQVHLDKEQIPNTVSASKHQSLINCPYQFFSQTVLGVRSYDSIDSTLKNKDFGELVHKCLHAYHQQTSHTPTLEAGVKQLTSISKTLFAEVLEQQVFNQGWWLRWEKIIPRYIQWQMSREAQQWSVVEMEANKHKALNTQTKLHGYLDRIDIGDLNEHAVIDYKTGTTATANKIKSGEDVQLLTYGMFVESVSELLYLELKPEKITPKKVAQPDLIAAAEDRLQEVFNLMAAETKLPAWGDEKTCEYCDYIGLCRKGSWNDEIKHELQHQ